jgi:hypothetical protein
MEDDGICMYFMGIWSILQPFGRFNRHLVCFGVIWYIFHRFGMLYQEKSGSPGEESLSDHGSINKTVKLHLSP